MKPLLINGEHITTSNALENRNPSDEADVIDTHAQAGIAETQTAIAAARAAFPAWSRSGPQARHDLLRAVSDEILARRAELGELLAREEGKTLPAAIGAAVACPDRKVLAQIAAGQEPDLSGSLDDCAFLLESLTGLELMRQFRDQHLRLVFVVDEYGEVEGLVTPDDLLHALTGGLYPSDPREVEATRNDDDGTWLLAGTLDAGTAAECLSLAELPHGDDRDYQTLGGMLMTLLDHVPEPGDTVNWAGWRFEIQDMQGQRIVRVRAVPLAKKEGGEFVAPTDENAVNGTYPLSRLLWVYVNKPPNDPLSPMEREFFRMVLSAPGQEVVQKDGYTALPEKIAARFRKQLGIDE